MSCSLVQVVAVKLTHRFKAQYLLPSDELGRLGRFAASQGVHHAGQLRRIDGLLLAQSSHARGPFHVVPRPTLFVLTSDRRTAR